MTDEPSLGIGAVRVNRKDVVASGRHRSAAQASVTGRLHCSRLRLETFFLDAAFLRKRPSAETRVRTAAADARGRIARDHRARLAEMAATIGKSS
jgi:hypothetical protein